MEEDDVRKIRQEVMSGAMDLKDGVELNNNCGKETAVHKTKLDTLRLATTLTRQEGMLGKVKETMKNI